MNAQQILMWAQVGGELVKIGAASIGAVLEFAKSAGVEADDAQLQRLLTIIDERQRRAEAEAARPPV